MNETPGGARHTPHKERRLITSRLLRVLVRPRTFSEVARFAQRLKILDDCLSAEGHRNNVIGVEDDIQMSSRASATRHALKTVAIKHLEPEAGANIPALGFGLIRPGRLWVIWRSGVVGIYSL